MGRDSETTRREKASGEASLRLLGSQTVLRERSDVATAREANRQGRLRWFGALLGVLFVWVSIKAIDGSAWTSGLPAVHVDRSYYTPIALIIILGTATLLPLLGAGRSPHVTYRASEIDVRLTDVIGADAVTEEIVKTLNLFLAYRTFRDRMGGTPRRAVLFEGPPGTGKTYMAKAMAGEARVPFLFVSSSAFQSMYYGQTNRKIRAYFRALRKAARREGGAIGFIEEIDAIGAARSGMGGSSGREGITGVVNELLIQLQSFDEPTFGDRMRGGLLDLVNRLLPAGHQLPKANRARSNILVVGATNRASDLDPALLRPGRFDRSIFFDLPNREGRRDILAYYLARKAHEPALDDPAVVDNLAAMTLGYSPAMLEHVLDEALVWAIRRGAGEMSMADITQAKMTEELGLTQPSSYSEAERRTIATHEAGHATVAWVVGKSRKLELLSIMKRKAALGLLAHSDTEERYTQTRTELAALIKIAMGGLVAEELLFGEAGTGPSGDLQSATTAAAQMVGAYGMAGSLISLEAATTPGGANLVAKVLADDAARAKVEGILADAKAAAARVVAANRDVVEALRDALLEQDELDGNTIVAIIDRTVAVRTTPAEQHEIRHALDMAP
jgi:cell division protease FtsH